MKTGDPGRAGGITESEIEAAERSILAKVNEAVQRGRTGARKSILLMVLILIISIPFIHGMPLNAYFVPWGQLLLVAIAVVFSWAAIACSGFLSAWFYRRQAQKLLESARRRE